MALHFQAVFFISTHAPRTGSDPEGGENTINVLTFQPTLPARGATRQLRRFRFRLLISTHAPRTGSDETRVSSRSAQLFQPTLPARGATRMHLRQVWREV